MISEEKGYLFWLNPYGACDVVFKYKDTSYSFRLKKFYQELNFFVSFDIISIFIQVYISILNFREWRFMKFWAKEND